MPGYTSRFTDVYYLIEVAAPITLFTALSLSGLQWASYDANTHLFFATHYMRYPFSTYDPRWYGGFSVLGYSPLYHELTAIMASVVGLKPAYTILCLVSYALVALGSESLAREYGISWRWVLPVTLGLPSLFLFSFVFGQQPTIMATGFALISASRLTRWMRGGKVIDLMSSSISASLAVSSHHVTAAFFLPLLAILSLIHARGGLARFAAWASLSILLSSPVLYGIVFFIIHTQPQRPIIHASRENILSSLDRSMMFFWAIYGFLPALIPYLIAEARADMRQIPTLSASILLLLMGLGGTTPLPKLILGGGLWNLLTYEKFSLWSSILLAILASGLLDRARLLHELYLGWRPGPRFIEAVRASFIVGMIAVSISAVAIPSVMPTQPPRPNIELIASYLDGKCPDGLYLTLGMGTWSRELSYTVSKARTLDGGYNTARLLPILRESGVESLDSAKYFPGGVSQLKGVLSEWKDLGISCVVVEDKGYDGMLRSLGYREVESIGGSAGVEIWKSPGWSRPVSVSVARPPAIAEALWSVVPPIIMALFFVLEAIRRWSWI